MATGTMPAWTINGRYLTQPVTGVQRYAREIVAAIERLQRAGQVSLSLTIVAPPALRDLAVDAGHAGDAQVAAGTAGVGVAGGIVVQRRGNGAGHRWEQLSLPSIVDGGLLCLGNTGPLRVARQILCIHDTNVHTYPASYSRGFRLAYRLLQPLLARRVALLTTVSRTSADLLRRHGVAGRTPIEVLPNGHEHVLAWQAQRSTLFARQPVRRPYVLLIGSRAPHKNMARILALADELDRLGLDIFVSGAAARIYADNGAQVAQRSNVRWLGFVSDDDLALLYRDALCLVFPSYVEGFGLPLVEAMALGCPIICSDASCLPEIAGDAALLADPDDGPAWLAAIARLQGSATLRAELVGRGRVRVRTYSWEASAAGYVQAMRRLSGG